MKQPLVTVMCLCYNHAQFVREAIESVFQQTYQPIELIVMDDGSTDNSAQVIEQCLQGRADVTFVRHEVNQGYTKTLNEAVALSKGEWLIDLAADDVLLPQRVEEGIRLATERKECSIHFSDAEIIDTKGQFLRKHSDRFPHASIPQGDIYCSLINRYFLLSPTLMFRKEVIERIGGYDENMAFEDFDFLMRASRQFLFCYSPIPLIRKRMLRGSLSDKQFKRGSSQRWSTLNVCEKVARMNRTSEEHRALQERIRYEIRVSLQLFDFKLAFAFARLYFRLSSPATMLR
ncbi:MAG: glycosyltransferase family 2 protein [Cyclobacteriaceae bacterium]|jgi:glycosyltransferase involved in cell wall biosynthesis|nr:glycosyltransferase [Flammeovirgaceae bacterium]